MSPRLTMLLWMVCLVAGIGLTAALLDVQARRDTGRFARAHTEVSLKRQQALEAQLRAAQAEIDRLRRVLNDRESMRIADAERLRTIVSEELARQWWR